VGICILGIYEGYKRHYFRDYDPSTTDGESPLFVRSLGQTPLDFLFYLSIINNIFSVFGLAGVLNAQRELVISFFAYNAIIMIVDFNYFWDLYTDVTIRYTGKAAGLTSYEQAMTAFVFFNFFLSICAIFFAIRALDEIRQKNREELNHLTVMSESINYGYDD
jgi:hypothetical protein